LLLTSGGPNGPPARGGEVEPTLPPPAEVNSGGRSELSGMARCAVKWEGDRTRAEERAGHRGRIIGPVFTILRFFLGNGIM
jgi:hypothetical protein